MATDVQKFGPPAEVRKVMGLDDAVNFADQDSEALIQVFQKQKKRLWDELGSEYVADILHIGSSSIKGMPGPPCVDMLMFVHTWPPAEAVLKGIERLGFFSLGNAPHFDNDIWFGFLGSPETKSIMDLGGGVVHVVHAGNKEAFEKQILWAEYCNNNKEAFEAYKQIKLEAKESKTIIEYKLKKTKMMQALFPKALEWKKQQMANKK